MREHSHHRTVLVVEDDNDVRGALVEALADHDFHSVEAANGLEALEKLRVARDPPCLILLDMMMPVMDGRAFREVQSSDPVLAKIPVVVLTAHANAAEALGEMGADGYLRKPVQLSNLIGTIQRFC